MNRTLAFAPVLAAGLLLATAGAQTAPATAPAAAAAPSTVAPQAIPAKVAIVAFEQVVVATNEGQRALADVQKKYEPQKAKIDTQASEVDRLRKELQALPANTADDERTRRLQAIDKMEKQLNLDAENANNSYQEDLQKAYGVVAQKVGQTAVKYAQDNGFTLVLNEGGSQQAPSPLFWWAPVTDISQAVVNAYNTSSGIAAPPPSAPAPARRTTPPASTTPRTH